MNPGSKKAQSKPEWMDDPQMAMLGRMLIMEEQMAAFAAQLKQLQGQIDELKRQDRRPHADIQLFTEKTIARFLRVDKATLFRWRKSKLISFIEYTGGDIRYRRSDIESFIKQRQRLSKADRQAQG